MFKIVHGIGSVKNCTEWNVSKMHKMGSFKKMHGMECFFF